TGAACRAAPPRLPDIRRQLPALAVPPRLVHPERLGPTRARQPVEARLGNRDGGPAGGLLQPELHQGGRLSRVVHLRVDRIRVPAIGEVALGFDPLDQDLQRDMLIAREGEPPPHSRAGGEWTVKDEAEPGAELGGVRNGPPDAGTLGGYLETLLDPVSGLWLVGLGGHGRCCSCQSVAGSGNAQPLRCALYHRPQQCATVWLRDGRGAELSSAPTTILAVFAALAVNAQPLRALRALRLPLQHAEEAVPPERVVADVRGAGKAGVHKDQPGTGAVRLQ